jgi:type II secretory pathway component PulF
MLFPSTASLSSLIAWSRSLRHQLQAGLPIVRVFEHASTKGPRELRPVAARIATDLGRGDSLEDALEREKNFFPPLFRELATIGERTGSLPEMFGELEEYFSLQRSLKRQFYQQITWPVFQFFASVIVIALLIWILGMLSDNPIAPIGMGLTGADGAIKFLIGVAVILGSLYAFYKIMTRGFKQAAAFSSLLLRLPAIGPCVEALAMHRFCIALRLTLETAMPTQHAIRLTLQATANSAYTQFEDMIVREIKDGEEIARALGMCPHFSREFIEIVEVGEVSGRLPETMIRQAEYYKEEAERRMKGLTRAASFGVWLLVAILIIIAIFKIAGIYFNALGGVGA